MDIESDSALEFLNREKEMMGDLENEISITNDEQMNSGPTSDDFFIVSDNDTKENSYENGDVFIGMEIPIIPQKEVPEKIKLWNEQQTHMLKEKDKQEENAIEELKLAGKKDLEDWYRNYQSSLDKTKSNNRMNQLSISNGIVNEEQDIWKCVYNLCDFSQQKTIGAKDRMKNILLQLNQIPLNKNCA